MPTRAGSAAPTRLVIEENTLEEYSDWCVGIRLCSKDQLVTTHQALPASPRKMKKLSTPALENSTVPALPGPSMAKPHAAQPARLTVRSDARPTSTMTAIDRTFA